MACCYLQPCSLLQNSYVGRSLPWTQSSVRYGLDPATWAFTSDGYAHLVDALPPLVDLTTQAHNSAI